MSTIPLIFAIGWAAFWLYWLGAALHTLKARVPSSRRMGVRVVFVIIMVLLLHTRVFKGQGVRTDSVREAAGLALFALGLAFAIWARVHIGKNWGTPMTQKVEPELVTSGPYHLVRHPIYSGILAAGVGTAVALSWLWLIAVALIGAYFIYSATNEERYMTTQFPDAYPAYKKASKMLVPFIF